MIPEFLRPLRPPAVGCARWQAAWRGLAPGAANKRAACRRGCGWSWSWVPLNVEIANDLAGGGVGLCDLQKVEGKPLEPVFELLCLGECANVLVEKKLGLIELLPLLNLIEDSQAVIAGQG